MKKSHEILIVEDYTKVRTTIKNALSNLNCAFTEAESGEQALRQIRKAHFDLIILDIKLPGIDGIETLRRAKEIKPNLPSVIVLTGHPDVETAFPAGKLEVFAYLSKHDLAKKKLREVVVNALDPEPDFHYPCFKHNVMACLYNSPFQGDFVFVGMPFSLVDIYEYGIKPTIESLNLKSWRADEAMQTEDIGCKICAALQSCKLAIMEVSESNPNVCIEIGLAYGYRKRVLLLRKKDAPRPPSDLDGLEYVPYSSIENLRSILAKYLKAILE